MLGHHHRARREGRGRAQDGADIVRVAHLVEQHDDLRARGFGDAVEHVVDVAHRQRLGGQRHALVDRALRQ